MKKQTIYRHYGARQYDPNLVREIIGTDFVKPGGGLWASPVTEDGTTDWLRWCNDEGFRKYEEDDCFDFTLLSKAKVHHIHCVDDIKKLPMTKLFEAQRLRTSVWNHMTFHYIDFVECVKEGIDAIELHMSDDRALYYALYGWDCDSILILNKNIIKPL